MTINITDANQVKQLIDNNEAILIDVRSKDEYDYQHIKDAILIPFDNFNVDQLPKKDNKKIIFHCASGIRSNYICQFLQKEGYKREIYNFAGSIMDLINVGFVSSDSTDI